MLSCQVPTCDKCTAELHQARRRPHLRTSHRERQRDYKSQTAGHRNQVRVPFISYHLLIPYLTAAQRVPLCLCQGRLHHFNSDLGSCMKKHVYCPWNRVPGNFVHRSGQSWSQGGSGFLMWLWELRGTTLPMLLLLFPQSSRSGFKQGSTGRLDTKNDTEGHSRLSSRLITAS